LVELTDERPPNSTYIDGYGPDGFRIGGRLHTGPTLVGGSLVAPWAVGGLAEATPESLAPLFDADPGLELLVLGCGPQLKPPPKALSAALRERKIGLEPMDTGAACRTYNLLLIEDRRVAAALLPVDTGRAG
jgi:uncharacterized protein